MKRKTACQYGLVSVLSGHMTLRTFFRITVVATLALGQALGQAHAPEGSQPPAKPELAAAKAEAYPDPPDVNKLTNPLTQILMLTAIVVGVATLGVGLALAQKVYQQQNSFDEDEILENQTK